MKSKGVTRSNLKRAFPKRLGFTTGVIILIAAATQFFNYATGTQIQYSLKEADCSSQAITIRNKVLGASLNSCVLIVSAKNLQDKPVYVDYDGTNGGPAGSRVPLIRIYSNKGKFCYALLAGEGVSFPASATNELTLRCGRMQKPPKGYDETSDANPASIAITGDSKTRISVDPVW
ncbi:MAG TPA: hypothetical protein VLG16_02955 [Candidatus Saccharimonadales bacterium]|nr:hypothetical protein [Candidatus Saccharimonadales bacterium]